LSGLDAPPFGGAGADPLDGADDLMTRNERMEIAYVAGVLLVIGATQSACLNVKDAILSADIRDVQPATL
jgi:hypothetical protein